MKRVLFFVLLLMNYAYAQKSFEHEVQLTETKFALESQIHGLKWGFLHNMDTGALGLGPQGYMNLYRSWESRPEAPGFTLLWKPAIVFWSDDGLFGLTSGPFYTKGLADSVLNQNGHFFTIWKRNKLSEPYKIMLDIGVNLGKPAAATSTRYEEVRRYAIPVKKFSTGNTALAAYNKVASVSSLKQALEDFSNEQTYMLFSGHGPLKWSELDKVAGITGQFTFEKTGSSQLSPSTYYEWGRLYREGVQTLSTNYFVHVWSMAGGKPVLLVALYRIN